MVQVHVTPRGGERCSVALRSPFAVGPAVLARGTTHAAGPAWRPRPFCMIAKTLAPETGAEPFAIMGIGSGTWHRTTVARPATPRNHPYLERFPSTQTAMPESTTIFPGGGGLPPGGLAWTVGGLGAW